MEGWNAYATKGEKAMSDLRSALSVLSIAVFVTTVVFVTPSMVVADGKHRSKICVTNSMEKKIAIYAYNGTDVGCLTPHKIEYDVKPGSTVMMKCHGQGEHRCFIGSDIMACAQAKNRSNKQIITGGGDGGDGKLRSIDYGWCKDYKAN